MRQYIRALLLALVPVLSFAQGENDNWYFGDHAGVNFASPAPAVLTNSQMSSFEACGAVSDANGNLLFYTNGVAIWNRDHQIMQNGWGLAGHTSSQQLTIVKHPANPNQYYVFTTALTTPTQSYIAYSIVDMSSGNLDIYGNPLGEVLPNFKNIPVLDNTNTVFQTEAITAVPHADGVSFWVLIPKGNKLYSYLVNNSGFNNNIPVISNVNFVTPLVAPYYFNIRVSPQLDPAGYSFSNYVCINHWNGTLEGEVLSFDNSTGMITNDYQLQINSLFTYASEFNKDATILYLGRNYNAEVYAIDLSSTSSVVYNQIYSNPALNCYAIQRNKYNDVYLSFRDYGYLSKVINPDVYGASSVQLDDIYLGGKITQLGLPQLIPGVPTQNNECIPDIVLTLPETHNLHTYQISNTITTKERYTVFPKQDITMKAGKNITMLPNTYVMYGARFLATIAACELSEGHLIEKKGREKVSLYLDLDKDMAPADAVTVYPNPASTVVIIDTKKERLVYWELYDMLGKLVLKGEDSKINVAVLAKNTYLLKIGTGDGAAVYKKLSIQ